MLVEMLQMATTHVNGFATTLAGQEVLDKVGFRMKPERPLLAESSR